MQTKEQILERRLSPEEDKILEEAIQELGILWVKLHKMGKHEGRLGKRLSYNLHDLGEMALYQQMLRGDLEKIEREEKYKYISGETTYEDWEKSRQRLLDQRRENLGKPQRNIREG